MLRAVPGDNWRTEAVLRNLGAQSPDCREGAEVSVWDRMAEKVGARSLVCSLVFTNELLHTGKLLVVSDLSLAYREETIQKIVYDKSNIKIIFK